MRNRTACLLAFLIAFAALPAAAPAEDLTGTTMNIRQEMLMGDLSAESNLQAWFLDGGKFRVEGVMHYVQMEMDMQLTVVSDGKTVKQLSSMPMGVQAATMDLDRVAKAFPGTGYDPSTTYSPLAYRDMLKGMEDKTSLGKQEMDGVETEGWEVSLEDGRNSLPANVSLGLPNPSKLRIWLGVNDGIPRRVEMDNVEGVTFLKMSYSNIKQNVAIPSSNLELAWPEGVKPIDITDFVLSSIIANRTKPATPDADNPLAPEEAKP
jgi:outer membrane lipoprotein-sorting protein